MSGDRVLPLIVVTLASALVLLGSAACGTNGRASTKTEQPLDQCPRSAFQVADPPEDVEGPFSEKCIREHFGSGLAIPDLTPRYSRTSFVVNAARPNIVGVFYHPADDVDDPVLRINAMVDPDATAAGFRSVKTANGTRLFISAVPNDVTASIRFNGVVYEMIAVGADPSIADELFLWIANTMERS